LNIHVTLFRMTEPQIPGGKIVGIAVLFEGALIVLAWGLGLLLGTPFGDQTLVTAAAVGLGVAATVPLLLGFYWTIRTSWPVLVRLRRVIEEQVTPLFAGCTVWGIAVISILAGVGEEALFRGIIQTNLAGLMGVVPALLVTSVLFGLVHFVTSTYALMAGIIGLYLGVITIWSGNLFVPMVIHGLYDFVALMYLVRYMRPAPETSDAAATGPPARSGNGSRV
jgi:membrane protease YdiL (CAAX protease family)